MRTVLLEGEGSLTGFAYDPFNQWAEFVCSLGEKREWIRVTATSVFHFEVVSHWPAGLGKANSCNAIVVEDISAADRPERFREGRSGLIFYRHELGDHFIAQGLHLSELSVIQLTAISTFFSVQCLALHVRHEVTSSEPRLGQ